MAFRPRHRRATSSSSSFTSDLPPSPRTQSSSHLLTVLLPMSVRCLINTVSSLERRVGRLQQIFDSVCRKAARLEMSLAKRTQRVRDAATLVGIVDGFCQRQQQLAFYFLLAVENFFLDLSDVMRDSNCSLEHPTAECIVSGLQNYRTGVQLRGASSRPINCETTCPAASQRLQQAVSQAASNDLLSHPLLRKVSSRLGMSGRELQHMVALGDVFGRPDLPQIRDRTRRATVTACQLKDMICLVQSLVEEPDMLSLLVKVLYREFRE